MFAECNRLYFNDELKEIPIEFEHNDVNYGEFYYDITPKGIDNCHIKIADNHERTKKEYVSTLVHEMIHYKIMSEIPQSDIKQALWYKDDGDMETYNKLLLQGEYVHSDKFKNIASLINKIYDLNIHLRQQMNYEEIVDQIVDEIEKVKYFNNLFAKNSDFWEINRLK